MTAITAKPITATPITARPLTAYGLGESTDGAAAFNPVSLFSSGENGAYFDAATIATLLQDSAGTTPVTAVGQPIGLLLDQSQGTVDLTGNLGAETVTNGDFASGDLTGWDDQGNASAVVSGGIATVTHSAAGNWYADRLHSLDDAMVAGKMYRVSYDARAVSGANSLYLVNAATTLLGASLTGTMTTYSKAAFKAVATYFSFLLNGGAGVYELDNVSVKLIPGNHAQQVTSTARPVLAELSGARYVNFDGVDDDFDVTMPDLGSNATIALIAADGTVSYQEAQTISGAITLSTDFQKLLYIDRALTAAEKAGWESLA